MRSRIPRLLPFSYDFPSERCCDRSRALTISISGVHSIKRGSRHRSSDRCSCSFFAIYVFRCKYRVPLHSNNPAVMHFIGTRRNIGKHETLDRCCYGTGTHSVPAVVLVKHPPKYWSGAVALSPQCPQLQRLPSGSLPAATHTRIGVSAPQLVPAVVDTKHALALPLYRS